MTEVENSGRFLLTNDEAYAKLQQLALKSVVFSGSNILVNLNDPERESFASQVGPYRATNIIKATKWVELEGPSLLSLSAPEVKGQIGEPQFGRERQRLVRLPPRKVKATRKAS